MGRKIADKIRTRAWVISESTKKFSASKSGSGIWNMVRLAVGMAGVLLIILSPVWLTRGSFTPYMNKAAGWSIRHQTSGEMFASQPNVSASIVPAEVPSPADAPEDVPQDAPSAEVFPADQSFEDLAPVKELALGNEGDSFGGVYVRNTTKNHTIDISGTLKEQPECKIKLNAGYQVLIIHTHTTECYAAREDGFYDKSVSARTTDKSKSVVAVGGAIASQLNDAGIRTLHITAMHDYPAYNGSYERAEQTIKEILAQHPSIEMVIDVHRDSVTLDDGTKYKPTAVINEKKAAQIMIISGCDDNGKLGFPNWKKNLRMGVTLQQQIAADYPGLARPLNFAPYRYNMHLTPNSLLVEFGTDVNTLDEAVYSGELFGKSLVEVLSKFVVS